MPSFFNKLISSLEDQRVMIPAELLSLLPRSWKRIGAIAIINLKHPLWPYRFEIGQVILDLLGVNRIITVMHARTIITVPGNMKKNVKKGYRSMHVGQEARPWQDSALQACVVFLSLLGI